jgi:hypothetical protein
MKLVLKSFAVTLAILSSVFLVSGFDALDKSEPITIISRVDVKPDAPNMLLFAKSGRERLYKQRRPAHRRLPAERPATGLVEIGGKFPSVLASMVGAYRCLGYESVAFRTSVLQRWISRPPQHLRAAPQASPSREPWPDPCG